MIARRASSLSQGGVKGKVGDACKQLTAFTLDSEEDVQKMKADLQETLDKIKDLDKKKQ